MKKMTTFKTALLFSALMGLFFPVNVDLSLFGEQEIVYTFKNKTAVNIETFSGNCTVEKGTGDEVKVRLVYTDMDTSPGTTFKPEILEDGPTLVLKEKFHLSGSGSADWYLTVPEKTGIEFKSISGNFSAVGLRGDIDAKAVSGDITVRDLKGRLNLATVSGEVEADTLAGEVNIKSISGDISARELEGTIAVKTVSGDIEIDDSRGSFDVKTASGDIKASGIIVKNESYFKVASGDVQVKLGGSPAHNLSLASASGDAVLNYNGNPGAGYFEFKALADSGKIISPFAFDREEEEEKWGKKYLIKSFKRKGDLPKILIHTASGKAVLEEK